ncbi:rhamnose-binding lectin-like isoform X1 [Sparus aurata]|uniref:rhamnose-binding lectin-like isoform X1 n=1 Tax=Sparus aurata TaxID=8175 RepID=UPI0011C1931D|nr:rhamnose-binding lectin-like isoform X1 [Sparus aurata]
MDRVALTLLTFLAVVLILSSVTGQASSELSWPSVPSPVSSSEVKESNRVFFHTTIKTKAARQFRAKSAHIDNSSEEEHKSEEIHPAPPGKRKLPTFPLGFPLFNNLYPVQSTRPSSFEGVICEGKSGQFRCLHRKTIKIESAVYGRQKENVCLSSKLYGTKQSTSCRRDVTTTLGNLCDGNTVCYVHVTNAVMGGDPCPHTYKYLSFSARCV